MYSRDTNRSEYSEAERGISFLTMLSTIPCIIPSVNSTSSPALINNIEASFLVLAIMQTVEGCATMLTSGSNICKAMKNKDENTPYTGWKKCQDIGDFATGLALFGTGLYALAKIANSGTTNDLTYLYDGMHVIATAQSIKAGYNFLLAANDYMSSSKTGEELDILRREVLFHGLKFVGFTLISCGFYPAGAAFLGAALLVSLYPCMRPCFGSMISFFTSYLKSSAVDAPTLAVTPTQNPQRLFQAS